MGKKLMVGLRWTPNGCLNCACLIFLFGWLEGG